MEYQEERGKVIEIVRQAKDARENWRTGRKKIDVKNLLLEGELFGNSKNGYNCLLKLAREKETIAQKIIEKLSKEISFLPPPFVMNVRNSSQEEKLKESHDEIYRLIIYQKKHFLNDLEVSLDELRKEMEAAWNEINYYGYLVHEAKGIVPYMRPTNTSKYGVRMTSPATTSWFSFT